MATGRNSSEYYLQLFKSQLLNIPEHLLKGVGLDYRLFKKEYILFKGKSVLLDKEMVGAGDFLSPFFQKAT